jgi:D-alanyl-D-alanine carboxypeptidase/D-alanyl-D-alanine-endopeptidase (penicillin-binding protein 4)
VVSLRPQSNSVFFAVTTVVAAIIVATLVASPTPHPIEAGEPVAVATIVVPPSRVAEVDIIVEPEPIRIRTCQVEPGEGDFDIAGSVILPATGEVLWEVGAEDPVVPASVLKLVTASAALRVLGPDFRFTTRVVEGFSPGEVWLVGGGDPTLSRTRSGATTYYTDPARVSDLVEQIILAAGDTRSSEAFSRVGIDTSRYDAFPTWNDTWRPNAAALGFVAPVTALMVDGGRLAPGERLAQRTTDPVGQATTAFMRQLGETTGFWRSEVVQGVAPSGGRVLAEVTSPPLSVLVDQMIRDSDNQIAEALIREVAVALSVTDVDEAAREGLALDTPDRGLFFADDGSGLSQRNTMTSAMATAVMADLVGDVDRAIIVDALPTPGDQGSLLRRFSDVPDLWADISGKTGSLSGVRSLAGVINADEVLVYSVFVTGPRVDDASRDVIDNLVARFYTCGENLAHWVPTEPGD